MSIRTDRCMKPSPNYWLVFLKRHSSRTETEVHFISWGLAVGREVQQSTLSFFWFSQGISFTYTFTDISGSLVTAAKRRFSERPFVEFLVLDIEKKPPEKFLNRFHTIISTNCVQATRNLQVSIANIR